METRDTIRTNIQLITSVVSTLIILLSPFSGFELRPIGVIVLIVGVAYELWRRVGEARAQKARLVESVVKRRIADFRDKFSIDKKSSVLWSIAESECKFVPSRLWSNYQKCYSRQQEQQLEGLEEDLRNAARASNPDSLSKCFVEIYHIANNYCSFLVDFAEEFRGKMTTDFGMSWFKDVAKEYDAFAERLEEDLRTVETELGQKLGAPEIRKATGQAV